MMWWVLSVPRRESEGWVTLERWIHFATGVLPIAMGRATKLIQYLEEDLKVYETTIRLGSATDTGDWTGTTTQQMTVPRSWMPTH